MRIESVSIDGCGIFHNATLGQLPEGLTVVLGDNEAGKSTLLAFIRAILFGFPTKNHPDYNAPLEGGSHGGRLGLVLENGDSAVVERKAGARGGEVVVTTGSGSAEGKEALARLLGGATADLYRNIYAFSLDELQNLTSLQGDGVKNVLYGASLGVDLAGAEKQINKRIEEIFKPKGQKSLINLKLAELETVRKELREAKDASGQYDALCERLRLARESIEDLRAESTRLRIEERKTAAYVRLWPDWVALGEFEREIAELPEVIESFPPHGLADLDRLKTRVEEKQSQLADAETECENLAREKEQLRVDEALLEQSRAAGRLAQDRMAYGESLAARPLDESRRDTEAKEIRRSLGRLGAEWTEERARAFDHSLFTRDAIHKWRVRLDEVAAQGRRATEILDEKQKEDEKARDEESVAQEKVTALDGSPLEADENVVRELRLGRKEFDAVLSDLPRVESERAESQKRLDAAIAEIDPGWTPAHVGEFDASVSAYENIQEFGERIAQAERRQAEALVELNQAERVAEEKCRAARADQYELDRMAAPLVDDQDALEDRRAWLRALRRDLARREEIGQSLERQNERLDDKRSERERLDRALPDPGSVMGRGGVIAVAISVLAALVHAALLYQRGATDGDMAALGAGAAVFLFILLLWTRARAAKKSAARQTALRAIDKELDAIRDAADALRADADSSEENITRLLERLELSPAFPEPEELDRHDDRLQKDAMLLDRRSSLDAAARSAEAVAKTAASERERADEALRSAQDARAELAHAWRRRLEEIRLSPEMTPTTALRVFSKIETAWELARSVEEKEHRISQMRDARARYRTLAFEIPSLAPQSDADLRTAIDLFFEALERSEELRERHGQALGVLEEKRRRSRQTAAALEEARRQDEKSRKEAALAAREWRGWLEERGLPHDLSPETAIEACETLQECLERMNRKSGLDKEIERRGAILSEYERRAARLFDALGRPTPEPRALAAAMGQLDDEATANRETHAKSEENAKQLAAIETKTKAFRAQLDRLETGKKELFRSATAGDEHEFRNREKLYALRQQLLRDIAQTEKNILAAAGETHLDALKKHLEQSDREELEARQSRLEPEAAQAEEKLEERLKERTETEIEIERLRDADAIARLRDDEERLLVELRDATDIWRRYAVARRLLEMAREKFEKEQQPGVVRDAADFYAKITNGRYTRLIAPIGENTIEAVTPSGARKKPEALSRGAAEQLYLALRFGYIRRRARQAEPLPVVMDDILVNFDPGRARRAAEGILDLAREHQTLFFTCHAQTLELFRDLAPRVAAFRLQNGSFDKIREGKLS